MPNTGVLPMESDDTTSLLHVRTAQLAGARGDVPEDGSGIDGVWTDEFPDVGTDEMWFVAMNAEDDEQEYRLTEHETMTIKPFRAHFWYDKSHVAPAAIGTPFGGQALVGDEFERSTEDQIIASIEAVLLELGELDEPAILEDGDTDD